MGSRDRAISEVLGYVLVFSLVVATVGAVTVIGLDQLQSARDVEQLDNAERAFDLLNANMEDLSQRGAPSRSTEVRLSEARLRVSDPISVSFRAVDDSDPSNNVSESYTVWPVQYRQSGSEGAVVYAGGALFRTQREGGVVLDRPRIVADEDVVVPLVQTRSRTAQGTSGGTARVGADRAGTVLLVSETDPPFDTVFLNVTSPRADLWADMLDSYDAFACTLETSGATDRVWCEATDPSRVHFSIVRVDVELTD